VTATQTGLHLGRRAADAPGAAGFTILEIMIASAILTLGLVGILALFPVAINMGKQVVETSTAVVVAESVADAIREGIRNNLRHAQRGTYFILKHDGVEDPIPSQQSAERPDKDYYILLPALATDRGAFRSRDDALRVAKRFVYPESDPADGTSSASPNGGGDTSRADDDGDDMVVELSGGETFKDLRVDKVYKVGLFLPQDITPPGEAVLEDQKIDALKQYSFAFSIQASREDANLSQNEQLYQPANRLYTFRIMIFRGFNPAPPDSKPMDPIFEFDFEVST